MILNNTDDIKLGEAQVDKICKGETVIWRNIPYTKDGLIMWLDGIKNTRKGHDVTSRVWEDLVGAHDWLLIGDHVGWQDNCFKTIDTVISYFINRTIDLNKTFTLEICCERYDRSGISKYNTVFTRSDDALSIFRNGNKQITFKMPTPRPAIGPTNNGVNYKQTSIYAIANRETASAKLWTKYSVTTSKDVTFSQLVLDRYYYLLGGDEDHRYSGKIYGVRLYNRELSEEEMLHDWEADNKRFGLNFE